MRSKFSKAVERGRFREGPYASPPGATFGAFRLSRDSGVRLNVLVCDGAETGWDHVSVSLRKRCPTWGEMCWIKHLFFRPDEMVVQIHPRAEDYVDDHPHCLHLWRPVSDILPSPPPILVGLGRKSG
jgi:hypothetical protein